MEQSDLLVILGVVALLVRVGQLLYVTGLSRSKNAASGAMRSVVDACIATLAFVAVGAAIMFQRHNSWFGVRVQFMLAGLASPRSVGVIFFNASAVLIATGVFVGVFAERSQFRCTRIASLVLAGLIVPVAGKWARTGWLHDIGFVDVAGASFIHLTAGVCALVGAVLVGSRNGKYHRDGSASMIPGHNIPLATAGVLVAVVGWIAYVAGFSLGRFPLGVAALDTLLAAAMGGLASMTLGRIRYGKPDVTLTLIVVLGALVAVTGCAGQASPPAAIIIGAVAGLVVPLASVYIDLILKIDDPVGGIAIHAVGGVLGTIAPAVIVHGSPTSHAKQLVVQLLGTFAVAAMAAIIFGAAFAILRATGGLRAKEADEFDGLDLAEHDIGAYPDFQQTMIKSYHLREA